MNELRSVLPVSVLALSLMVFTPILSHADDMPQGGMMKGDGMMMKDNATVAISGYCPVCLLHGMKMKGSDNFVTEYKGKIYKFSTIQMQKAFLENPEENIKDLDAKFAVISRDA